MAKVFYSLTVAGSTGSTGVGVLVFDSGLIVGVDEAGVRYDGEYRLDRGRLEANIIVTVPPGVSLVTGAPPPASTYSFPLSLSIPVDDVEMPFAVGTPTGQVAAVLRKLREAP